MRILVLGGGGKMGSIAVQHLLQDARVSTVVVADINTAAAETVLAYLGGDKGRVQAVDLNDEAATVQALAQVDACVNATVYYTNLRVMHACAQARCHYVDLGGLFHTTRKQLELDGEFRQAGVSAVLGMGSAPGIPNVQARYAADRLDTIASIRIYDGIKPPPPGSDLFTYAVPTILDELTLNPMVFRDGAFSERAPLSEFEDYAFAAPLGVLPMHLSLHSEVATLPITYAHKGVKEVFFKINHWGMSPETVARVRVLADFGLDSRQPVAVRGQQVAPRDLLMELLAGRVPPVTEFLRPPAHQPPDWVKEIVTETRGVKDGREITYRVGTLTVKGALPTGVAPAIAAIWQAEGRIPAGVHAPEQVLDPEPFFAELKTRDIHTYVTITTPI